MSHTNLAPLPFCELSYCLSDLLPVLDIAKTGAHNIAPLSLAAYFRVSVPSQVLTAFFESSSVNHTEVTDLVSV